MAAWPRGRVAAWPRGRVAATYYNCWSHSHLSPFPLPPSLFRHARQFSALGYRMYDPGAKVGRKSRNGTRKSPLAKTARPNLLALSRFQYVNESGTRMQALFRPVTHLSRMPPGLCDHPCEWRAWLAELFPEHARSVPTGAQFRRSAPGTFLSTTPLALFPGHFAARQTRPAIRKQAAAAAAAAAA